MQVFNVYFKLIKKCIPIYIIYFLAFILLIFVKSNQSKEIYNEDYKITVGIINDDVTDKFAMNLATYLEKYCDINLIDNKADLSDRIYYGNINAIIGIPYGFLEDLLEDNIPKINVQAMDESEISLQLNALISHYINSFNEYRRYDNELSVDDIFKHLQNKLLNSEVSKKNNLDDTYVDKIIIAEIFNLSGYILIGCLFVTVGTVINIYHDSHLKKRITISLLQDRLMYGQLFLGNFIFTLCLDIILIIISYLFARNSINIFVMIRYSLNIFTFSISALTLSYFFAMLYNKKKELIYFIMIPVVIAFISGVFITQDNLRKIVLHVGSFNPLYWFVKNNNTILELSNIENMKENNTLINMVIQLLFSGVFFVLSSLLIKERRERN